MKRRGRPKGGGAARGLEADLDSCGPRSFGSVAGSTAMVAVAMRSVEALEENLWA